MNTQTKTIYLHAVMSERDDRPWYTVSDSDMASIADYTVVSSQEVTFEVPDEETILPLVLGTLERKRDTMRETANIAIAQVDNQIASLLALEHIPEEGAPV